MMYYTKEHEWLRCEGDLATVGITRHATDALGDIVFVDVNAEGTKLSSGDAAGVVESVKAASDIYAPVAGTITERNELVIAEPELVNTDPEERGWIYRIRLDDTADLSALLNRAAYDAFAADA